MSDTLNDVSRRTLTAGDRYLALLAIVLLGYALMGKGFAYIGFPPLYVGEIAFLIGIAVFLRSGVLVASIATLPAVVLVATMMWVLVRTVPFLNVYGFDALRDSVIILYGGFAFVVIGLLLEDARRIDTVIRYYRTVLVVFPAISVGFWLTKYWVEYVPKLYGPRADGRDHGELPRNASGGNRGFCPGRLPEGFVSVGCRLDSHAGHARRDQSGGYAGRPCAYRVCDDHAGTVALDADHVGGGIRHLRSPLCGEAISPNTRRPRINRAPVSAHQIVENPKSVVGQSGQQTEGTKQWRLDWWDVIINDTIHGPNFWTGRGFGLNIADEDGFAGTRSSSGSAPPNLKPAQRFYDPLGARRSAWRCLVVARAHILERHDAARDAGRSRPWTQTMDRALPVHYLLRNVDSHQCGVRRHARRAHAGYLVLVPVWLRHRVGDGLSRPAS